MKTLLYLLRWNFFSFVTGVCAVAFASYHLLTFVEPAPTPLSLIASSPVVDNFRLIMWVILVVGLVRIAGSVYRSHLMAVNKL